MCLKVVEVDGDGNCLFRAIADQIEGDEEKHEAFRADCVEYIENNKEHYKMFLDDDTEDIDEYLNNMRTNTTWGS